MNQNHRDRSLSYGERNARPVAAPDIPNREHTRQARFGR